MTEFDVIVMAAGRGTRMRSSRPKVLHEICGRPMVNWTVRAARAAGARRIVVVRSPGVSLAEALDDDILDAVQEQADGTAGAVAAGLPALGSGSATVVVMNCDHPLIDPQTLRELAGSHTEAGAAVTVATATVDDPAGYGRVVRGADGHVDRVVETKVEADATAEELAICEVNSGIYCFDAAALSDALPRVGTDNAQGERYLPDVISIMRGDSLVAAAHESADPGLMISINDRRELMAATVVAQRRLLERHALAGVTFVDPGQVTIDADVELAADVRIEPGTQLHGATKIGEGAVIGPCTTIRDSEVGAGAVVRHSFLELSVVGEDANVGPFAYLRPGAVLGEQAKAGTFVEIKNSEIGARTKVPHLSYIGDADIGPDGNLGAATITANYDSKSKRKSRTTLGSGVKTGVDTTLVAPVELGDDSYTAAGSVVTDDVPAGALAVARERQKNIDGYAGR